MILGIFRAFSTIKLVGWVRIRAAHPVCPHMVLPPPGSWRNRITRFIVKMMIFYIEVQHPYILKYSWYIQARPLIQGSSSRTFVTFLLETSVSFMKCTWKYPNSIIKGSTLWCLINVPPPLINFRKFFPPPRTLFGPPRLSIFANFKFSTCKIFK